MLPETGDARGFDYKHDSHVFISDPDAGRPVASQSPDSISRPGAAKWASAARLDPGPESKKIDAPSGDAGWWSGIDGAGAVSRSKRLQELSLPLSGRFRLVEQLAQRCS